MITRTNEINYKLLSQGSAAWKGQFGNLHLVVVLAIEKILACVQPELQASYTRNTYNNVLYCITCLIQDVHKLTE